MSAVDWWLALVGAASLWVVLLLGQVVSLLADVVDLRSAADRPIEGSPTRPHQRELIWSAAGGALLSVVAAFLVDLAVRLILDRQQAGWGLGLLALVVVVVATLAVAVVAGMQRPEAGTYRALRRDIAALASVRVSKHDVASLRAALARADVSQAALRLGARDRRGLRGIRDDLGAIEGPVARPGDIPLPIVRGFLARSPWRLAIPALGMIVTVGFLVLLLVTLEPWLAIPVVVCAVLVAASAHLAVASVRARLAARVAWNRVGATQRSEVVEGIALLERRASHGVAGLGDRVARALNILREQQGQESRHAPRRSRD